MTQPDIEIYIKHTTAEEITSWLTRIFDTVNINSLNEASLADGQMVKGSVELNGEIPVVITAGAAGKAFTSVWFQSDRTGWENDLQCAESFCSQYPGREVRCSADTWTESEEENDEKWWKLTNQEKSLIRWG